MEEDFLEQVQGKDIDLIVCSDAEAILGIGDQGVGVSVWLYALFIEFVLKYFIIVYSIYSLGNRGKRHSLDKVRQN